ncbi:MAG: FHA domain-containing protein [Planctomycetota bacterium]
MYGILDPVSDGDSIPLTKKRLRVGRREGNDIVINLANLSGHHALLELDRGYWFVRDLRSKNGVKVEGRQIQAGTTKRIDPGNRVSFGSAEYILRYDPGGSSDDTAPPPDEQIQNLFGSRLMDRAGSSKGIRRWDDPGGNPPLGGYADD